MINEPGVERRACRLSGYERQGRSIATAVEKQLAPAERLQSGKGKTYRVTLTDEERGSDGREMGRVRRGECWPEGGGEGRDGGESEEGDGHQVESETTKSR